MTAIQIWKSAHDEKFIYALHDSISGTAAYGIVLADDGFKHLCGYLNIDKQHWFTVDDRIRELDGISFEGIESTRLSIPVDFENRVPIPLHNFWIGIDHMGDKRFITPTDVAEELVTILEHIYAQTDSAI